MPFSNLLWNLEFLTLFFAQHFKIKVLTPQENQYLECLPRVPNVSVVAPCDGGNAMAEIYALLQYFFFILFFMFLPLLGVFFGFYRFFMRTILKPKLLTP